MISMRDQAVLYFQAGHFYYFNDDGTQPIEGEVDSRWQNRCRGQTIHFSLLKPQQQNAPPPLMC